MCLGLKISQMAYRMLESHTKPKAGDYIHIVHMEGVARTHIQEATVHGLYTWGSSEIVFLVLDAQWEKPERKSDGTQQKMRIEVGGRGRKEEDQPTR